MPDVARPDGAVIHYETFGSGYPLLLIASGAVSSEIGVWEHSRINPIREYADEFQIIAMDQRHAGASWNAPAVFSYDLAAADQLAVLDHAGASHVHVMGGCIGVGYVLRLVQTAPGRITAAVGQDPVGLDASNTIATFMAMFRPTIALARERGMPAVVEEALRLPQFLVNNVAGPFGPRLHADSGFRDQVRAMPAEEYVQMVERFAEAMWPESPPYFTVDEAWVRSCHTPLLILPGADSFHPTSVSLRLCEQAPHARCLDVDCRSDANLRSTRDTVRAFLREHVPA